MATMAPFGVLVVAFSCILKVGSLPTTNTVVAPSPTSKYPVNLIFDSQHNHGQDQEQSPNHHHHNNPSIHGNSNHLNKSLTSLGSLLHNILAKDGSHVTPAVHSFTNCVNNCLHPSHPPNPSDHQHDNNPLGDQEDVGRGRPMNHQDGQAAHERDGDDSDILNQIGELLRESNYHALLRSHQGTASGHLDDDMNRYWMCSHTCFLVSSGQYPVG